MSLYWYVDTKHDLLELALDSALGELALSAGPVPEGWPGRLRALARGYRRVLADHPWAAPLAAAYPNIGPHARAFDAALQRLLDATGLMRLRPDRRPPGRLAVPARLRGRGPAGARGRLLSRARRPDRGHRGEGRRLSVA